MAHFLLTDEETGMPTLRPVGWVVAEAEYKGDGWRVLNAGGATDDVLIHGTKQECRNFIKQVAELLADGVDAIDPECIDTSLEVL